ncbi:MAG TPA: tubulin-like doman-containing protein [Abditibacteriaceae bacterium]|jgi:hypothetical protein
MPQRTLILGLGSTGFDICKLLLERIEWEYGGLERTPWLEILVLETEEIQGDGILEKNTRRIMMSDTDFANLVSSPATFQRELDLESWWHEPTLRGFSGMAGKKGAGNIRMVGRLGFLYPAHFKSTDAALRSRLDKLKELTPQSAAQAVQPDFDPQNPPPPIPLSDEITVFVVGTLIGGTCSGSFIDAGYLLHQSFQKNGYPLQRVSIFTLPHMAYDPVGWQRRRANAYTALVELNHYMAGHTYVAQWPTSPGEPIPLPTIAPYDTTYLVQPQGGSTNDFEKVKLVVSQFLHTSIFTSNAGHVGAAMIDGTSSVVTGDNNGSPSAYYSFGLSAIEIPGYLIAQGCCYQLGYEAFSDFVKERPNAPVEADAFRVKILGIDEAKVGQWLLRDAGSQDTSGGALRKAIGGEIEKAVHNARNSGGAAAGQLAQVEEKINVAFLARGADAPIFSGEQMTGALPPYFVPDRVAANGQTLVQDYANRLRRELQIALRDPVRGPKWCAEVLDNCTEWINNRLSRLQDGKAHEEAARLEKGALGEMNSRRQRIDSCARDPFLALFFGRKAAVDRELTAYGEAAVKAFERKLEMTLLSPERALWEKLKPLIERLRARINSKGGDGLLQQAEMMRDIFKARLDDLNTKTPQLNGRAFYKVNHDIARTYEKVWDGREAEKEAAKIALLLSWPALPQLNDQNQLIDAGAYFEKAPLADNQLRLYINRNVERLAHLARGRGNFNMAVEARVLEELREQDTPALRAEWEKSAVLLDANRSNTTFTEVGSNNAHIVFLPPGDNARRTEIAGEVNSFSDRPFKKEDNASPQSLLFLQAFGGFPLAIIKGFQNRNFESTNFRHSFAEESRKNSILWSRADIEWHPFDGDRDTQSQWRMGLFLTALAFSRTDSADDTLIQLKSGHFVYKPAVPFQAGAGHDRVEFGRDLRRAAHDLREAENGQAQTRLQGDIMQIRAAHAVKDLARSLENLYNSIEQYRLTISETAFAKNTNQLKKEAAQTTQNGAAQNGVAQNAPTSPAVVTANKAYELIRIFWANDPQMLTELSAPFSTARLLPNIEKHQAGETYMGGSFRSSGYYCIAPHPGHPVFFGAEENDVPNRCPVCNQPCK